MVKGRSKRKVFSALVVVFFVDLVLAKIAPGIHLYIGDPFLAFLLALVIIESKPIPHWALAIGLLQDSYWSVYFGLHGFSKVLISLVAASLSGMLLIEGITGMILLGFASWFFQNILFYCYYALAGLPLPPVEVPYLLVGGLVTGIQATLWTKVLGRGAQAT